MFINDIHVPYQRDDLLQIIAKHKEEITHLCIIGDFLDCYSISSLIIPTTVTYIGKYAFKGCKGLKSIELNDITRVIREGTFEGCSNLKDINYPEQLETIETRAFYDCTSLEDITFYGSLKEIGTNAFYNCKSVRLTCEYNSYYSDGQSGWQERSKYLGESGLTTHNVYKLILPDKITEIPADEFINEEKKNVQRYILFLHPSNAGAARLCAISQLETPEMSESVTLSS